jgi:multidrug resistance protein, MATE family
VKFSCSSLVLTFLFLLDSVTFILFPLSLSIAVSIRLNRLLISQNHQAAKSCALIALFASTLFMVLSGFLLYEFRFLLGSVFTSDENIIRRVRLLAPIVAIFQMVNGLQGCAQGVMRGMGRQTELVGYLFVSYWIVAMPLGLYLAFYTRPRVGMIGIWYGYLTGLGLLSLILLLIILTTDWEREVRRSRLRYEKYQKYSSHGLLQSVGFIGSRALGGFMLMSSITDEEELDDIERIEVVLLSEQTEKEMEARQQEASRRHQL